MMVIERDDWRYLVHKKYIMSTNADVVDKVKNFTITPHNEIYTFYSGLYRMEDFGNDVPGSKITYDIAMELTYEDGVTQPTYISQAEPVLTSNTLSLSSTAEMVEYFLYIEGDQTFTDDSPFFLALSPLLGRKLKSLATRCPHNYQFKKMEN